MRNSKTLELFESFKNEFEKINESCEKKEIKEEIDSTKELLSRIFAQYPDLSDEDSDYLDSLAFPELIDEIKNRGWEDLLDESEKLDEKINKDNAEINEKIKKALKSNSQEDADELKQELEKYGIKVGFVKNALTLIGPNGKKLSVAGFDGWHDDGYFIQGPTKAGFNDTHYDKSEEEKQAKEDAKYDYDLSKRKLKAYNSELKELKSMSQEDIIKKFKNYKNNSIKKALAAYQERIKDLEKWIKPHQEIVDAYKNGKLLGDSKKFYRDLRTDAHNSKDKDNVIRKRPLNGEIDPEFEKIDYLNYLIKESEKLDEKFIEFPTEQEKDEYIRDNNLIKGKDYIDKGINAIELLNESEEYSFQEIITRMENATDYSELYDAALLIKDDKLRTDVEQAIGQCEDDGDDVETAYSIITSDLLDSKSNDINESCGKKKLKEDSYDSGIFYEIEQAFEEAGLNPVRFIDDGILTRNIGWTVSSNGVSQQISCDGSWYDEDEEDLDESEKLEEKRNPENDEANELIRKAMNDPEFAKTHTNELRKHGIKYIPPKEGQEWRGGALEGKEGRRLAVNSDNWYKDRVDKATDSSYNDVYKDNYSRDDSYADEKDLHQKTYKDSKENYKYAKSKVEKQAKKVANMEKKDKEAGLKWNEKTSKAKNILQGYKDTIEKGVTANYSNNDKIHPDTDLKGFLNAKKHSDRPLPREKDPKYRRAYGKVTDPANKDVEDYKDLKSAKSYLDREKERVAQDNKEDQERIEDMKRRAKEDKNRREAGLKNQEKEVNKLDRKVQSRLDAFRKRMADKK